MVLEVLQKAIKFWTLTTESCVAGFSAGSAPLHSKLGHLGTGSRTSMPSD